MVSFNNNQQEPINPKYHHHHHHHHSLSVQKPPAKPTKKPTTSAAPASTSNQPRVYNVKPIHFRELVQRLTGASQTTTQRLQIAAPPPIQLKPNTNAWAPPPQPQPAPATVTMPQELSSSKYQKKSTAGTSYSDGFMFGDSMELSLSPTSCSWFSFPLLSPGPLSNFGA